MNKKLIEVALPLEKINEASAREKSIRHGHPSTLHLWWARRPLAAARAVIWASLVDDPSSHPELFPTEEEQNKERERLFRILEELVVWENSNNKQVLDLAKQEILHSTNNIPQTLLDPFSGGGSIPFEAQRLGIKAHAHDLNPVAVVINKAMIEIPSIFSNMAPVNPKAKAEFFNESQNNLNGLAVDVRYYGERIKLIAQKRIGNLYPQITLPKEMGGTKVPVVAWIWGRTMKCSNPACGCTMPLVSSFVLSKKKGNEAWVEPKIENNRIIFVVHKGKCPAGKESNKIGRSARFKCPSCGQITTDEYVKKQGKKQQLGKQLMGIIGEGENGRLFVSPIPEHEIIASINLPDDYPTGWLPANPRWFSPPAFGMEKFEKLFTNRQLTALVTFSDLVKEIQREIELDAINSGLTNDHIPLKMGGKGAKAYSQAIAVYLAFAVDRCVDYYSMFATWSGEFIAHTFGRQAIPMVWDFAECNPFSNSTGNWSGAVNWICAAIEKFPQNPSEAIAIQFNSQDDCGLRNVMISTDPPYYDNIGYADLSDYFYIWLRRCINDIYPEIFSTMLVPKAEELVATPYRFKGGAEEAKIFFESGMFDTCKQLYKYAAHNIPITIYYAYRQNDTNDNENTSSSGWETMLSAIIHAGFSITGTWPMRTERTIGIKGHTNMLASSIVLVCRKRDNTSLTCTRRNFINELKRELRPALKNLQNSNIAPVDLAQSAIGPGMGVFSRYSQVLEADGTPMTVRSALQIINQELDLYFNEQDSELDGESRFCVDLYSQAAFNDIPFGDANTLATAKNTSVALMASHGMLYAKKGVVHLVERAELPATIKESEDNIWLLCQQLTYRMEREGIEGCAKAIVNMLGSNAERAKDLAYRLYTIAERKKWAQEAYAYNALVVAWPEIQSRAAQLKAIAPEQISLMDFLHDNN